ncbi:MAG: hypothetical protein HON92_14250 [Planctomycetaceae bacterium]|nr:hypothetical protein [Planctomycetaceae bacterium]
MAKSICLKLLTLLAVFTLSTSTCTAAPTADQLLPNTTKAFVSIPRLDDLQQRFEKTQIYQLLNDPVVKPFADDLMRQLQARFDQTHARLGISFEGLEDLGAGEAASAVLAPNDEAQPYAVAVIVDATGAVEQAQELVDRIGKQLVEDGAERSEIKIDDNDVIMYTITPEQNADKTYMVYYRIHEEHIVSTDHRAVMQDILNRFKNPGDDNVAAIAAYQSAMEHCQQAAADTEPQIRWFVEPLGYAKTIQAAAGVTPQGKNFHELLTGQGFDAIKGAGGWIHVAEGNHEFRHHTWVSAPRATDAITAQIAKETTAANAGTERDPRIAAKESDKYVLAMRMLDFPNSENQKPQTWIPNTVSTYSTINWNMKEAFEFAKTLVNEYLDADEGQDLFEEILKGIAHDVNGPQLDIRDEFVAYLAGRMSVITDYREPIDVDSNQWMAIINVTDAEAVEKAVAKFMAAEPNKHERVFQGQRIWEILNEEEDVDIEIELEIEFGEDGFGAFGDEGFGDLGDDEESGEEGAIGEQPIISTWAITVSTDGHVLIASSADFIEDIIKQQDDANLLSAEDYVRIETELNKMGAASTSMRMFTRLDDKHHPNYELIRLGKLEHSQTLMGKLLSRLMGSSEGGKTVEKIDVSKMPEFSAVEKYLGPSGTFVRTDDGGWFASGVVLRKAAPTAE